MELNFNLKKKKKKIARSLPPAAKRMSHILATVLGNPPSPARSLLQVSLPLPFGIVTPFQAAAEACGGHFLSPVRRWTLNHAPSLATLWLSSQPQVHNLE